MTAVVDKIVQFLRDEESHGKNIDICMLTGYAADEIERLQKLIMDYGIAEYNRKNFIGSGVDTWNAVNKAIAALKTEAKKLMEKKDD